jgi:uncharacterized phiE125 gp8 family phage protein
VALLLLESPSIEPVTLEDVKKHLHIMSDGQNSQIAGYIKSARSDVEAFLKMSLLPTKWKYVFDCFNYEIRLPIGPVLDANGFKVEYVDSDGITQEIDPAGYKLSFGDTGIVRPGYLAPWPTPRSEPDAVSITFIAGWTSAELIPPAIVQVVKMRAADFFEHRENTVVSELRSANVSQELARGMKNMLFPWARH